MAKRIDKDLKERTEALEDLAYWKRVGKVINCEVVSWSYRHSATLVQIGGAKSNILQIHSWLAKILLDLAPEPPKAECYCDSYKYTKLCDVCRFKD